MSKERADLGFGAALGDLSDFAPGGTPTRLRPALAEVQAAAGAAGFRSREPAPPAPIPADERPIRRRRTGRNAQFNVKVRAETIEAFCQIADAQGWGLGETLERAVVLMQREGWNKGPDNTG